MHLHRTTNTHPDFLLLMQKLDAEMHARYGELQLQYNPHNILAELDTALLGYVEGKPAACGCFKVVDERTVEIKRMYMDRDYRGKGYSIALLQALEAWAAGLGYSRAILETGNKQPEAIGLYKKCGYQIIENYGPYVNMPNSVCMEKIL
ncbi:MAG TPA: GNAT family N-acetyltransferase [bacterium]|nr:GNAT family N-acetyltransferase [bacterium]HPN42469.1 GNAT family N-acetyltransferase [bacterium]